jgi:3-phenylpropionate/trans-cinnamate dioxygenase ferredoxin reductase component
MDFLVPRCYSDTARLVREGNLSVRYDVLIAGTGHAGSHAAITLRQEGFSGTIAFVGDEPHLPYERPPLSKEYLSGDRDFDGILIRPEQFWAERDIRFFLGAGITVVSPAAREVRLNDGRTLCYSKLIWAAGGAPRRLNCEGWDLRGVHAIRNRSDVDRLIGELESQASVVIIGGGYIGLEAAAVLRKLGKAVVLLEALPRVLARVAGNDLSRFYEREHRAHGVDLRLDQRIARLEGSHGRVTAVRLSNGSLLDCGLVIVGIGIIPAVQPLAHAGADCPDGVLVDEYCRTSLRDIFAIGDCALHISSFANGCAIRLESVQNANDHANTVARFILGQPRPYAAVPWFWSHQYDLKLQTIGLSMGHDGTVLRGDPEARSFSIAYLRQGRVIALDCVNAVKDYVYGRKLVLSGATPERRLLADPAVSLKTLV